MARGKKCGGDAEASDARVGGGGSEWKCECEKSFLNGSQERLRGGETRGKARGEGDVVRCIGSAKDNRVCLMSCPELREHFLNHQKQSRSKSYECQSACTLLVICKIFFACFFLLYDMSYIYVVLLKNLERYFEGVTKLELSLFKSKAKIH